MTETSRASPSATGRLRLSAAAAAFGLCALALSWTIGSPGLLPAPDHDEYERIAFNLVHHGEFHDSERLPEERAAADLTPYSRRAPGYPLYLAAVLASHPGSGELSQPCLSDAACEAGQPVFGRARLVTSVLAAGTVVLTLVMAFVLTGSPAVSIAAGVAGLAQIPSLMWDAPSLLAGFLLLGHAGLAAHIWRRPRIRTGVLSGVCLGALALTKAVFQYWLAGVAVVLAAALWLDSGRRRDLLPACSALVIAAWTLALPWMVRNAVQVGHFGISGRDGEVLAIRAEYGRMTWPEVGAAFAYYFPDAPGARGVRALVMRRLEPDTFGYARFDRANPEGFYERAKSDTGDVAARADLIDPGWRASQAARDAALRQAAGGLMRADWLKQTVLTLAFAERGAFGAQACRRASDSVTERFGSLPGRSMLLACGLANGATVLAMPLTGALLLIAWRRRDAAPALLFLPAAYGFAIYAVATHFIERYARPLLPCLIVLAALAAHQTWRWIGSHRHRRPGPTARAEA